MRLNLEAPHEGRAPAVNVAWLLVRAARAHPSSPAIYHGRHLVAEYGELLLRVMELAHALRVTLRFSDGDRVGLCMANTPHYIEMLYAIWSAGLVAVPINAKLHPNEIAFIMHDAGAVALFADHDVAAGLGEAAGTDKVFVAGSPAYEALFGGGVMDPAPRSADDLAWLFYTSGTTGRPKGVMLSHRNLLTMISCYFIDVHAASAEDAVMYAAPFSHGAGLYNFPHVLKGARHVVPESGGFEPSELCALAAHHRNVCLFAAPTMVKRLVEHVDSHALASDGFRLIVYGGGPMYGEVIEHALAVMGDRFAQIYGQGESPMTITALSRRHLSDRSHPRYRERIASVGIAQALVEVRVADEAGRSLPAGDTGEVVVRGDVVMRGYWQNPNATAETIRDGWLYTGDMGCLDHDGFLTLKDRSKDVIISGGANIYPREVEEVLLTHHAVDECSVVGRAHADWGEEVVAFVVPKKGMTLDFDELDRLCIRSIARFKRPREYRLIATLPKNEYGKVRKTVLREMLSAD
ncbi:MAG: AMP-binding protein [Pseudomonadota bacterium]|nr:AMP-binding protein [Pseudomonadota bacterium]